MSFGPGFPLWAARLFRRERLWQTRRSRLVRPVVKCRKSGGIWRKLNRFLCFCAHLGFIEIGFFRRIFVDFGDRDHVVAAAAVADTPVVGVNSCMRLIRPKGVAWCSQLRSLG